MIRRLPPTVRSLIGQLAFLLVTYLIIELFMPRHRLPPDSWGPGRLLLIVACISRGIGRVGMSHPAYNNAYKKWLELTPWTNRQPLPMGLVALTWGDGIYMATVILLGAIQPEPRAMQLLCFFLLAHLAALLPTLWLGSWAIAYTTAAGLGLAVRSFHSPMACLAVCTLVYLFAYEGLFRSFERFPWKPGPWQFSHDNLTGDPVAVRVKEVGWPYGEMLVDLGQVWRLSRADAMLICLLVTWWLNCIAVLITDGQQRAQFLAMIVMPTMAIPFVRLIIYVRGYHSPLSLRGRLRLFKPILPGYDQVFVGPICSFLAMPMTLTLMIGLRTPLDIGLPIACGMTLLVALLTPPSLRRWRLTGAHRLVPTVGVAQSQGQGQDQSPYVRVG